MNSSSYNRETMLIVHENMPREAEYVAQLLQEVYGFASALRNQDLEGIFVPAALFPGHMGSSVQLKDELLTVPDQKVMVLTPRDIYAGIGSQDDDWIFGYCSGDLTLAATARMKRKDNQPSATVEVPTELYLKRVGALAVHEVGHDVDKAPHFRLATWVNDRTGHELRLGPHCTDNRCVMYEIVDIRAPPEGHMRLGDKKCYDAGLDDVIERMHIGWFCPQCKDHIHVPEEYKI